MNDVIQEVTNGIKISVTTQFREDYSDPSNDNYLFSYRIQIENQNDFTVQLLSRHWDIFDSNSEYREVKGAGIVGLKPTLGPGDVHEYESACNLGTAMGKMSGSYVFERKIDNKRFTVAIPSFEMFVPYIMN